MTGSSYSAGSSAVRGLTSSFLDVGSLDAVVSSQGLGDSGISAAPFSDATGVAEEDSVGVCNDPSAEFSVDMSNQVVSKTKI